MPQITEWINARLKKISQQEFTNHLPHRIPRPKKNIQIHHDYFAIPLSSGCGTAILTTPKNNENKNELGPLVILCHALGYDSTTPLWHWIYEFAAQGISILSIDWDGHGSGASSLLDIQEATRSLPLIINRLYGEENGVGLNAKRNGPKCFLMGHSFGASLSLIAVTNHDVAKHISGVIAIAPALCAQSFFKSSNEFFNFFKPSAWFSDFLNKFGYYGISGLIPPHFSFKRKQFPLRKKLNIKTTQQARDFAHETFEKRRILQKVKSPVLWFHGVKDTFCPYTKACQLMPEIPSAIFSICDNKRGHLRMIYNDQVMNSSIKFIQSNLQYYQN